ncbi:hypothetical protein R70723_24885 [Paenibacillus sp. FSL R7-0273]|uniref:hypothetical protein n=1 Tax=Paenibacillus sp. FSL R7-0273 TaxID=1536772 RepID=UPI0004F630AE|nr:hypothetical protein [Paenibacillus sp. FSL R7-0273]AIQ48779.1 hypothetical protein R70723_24885 [Paenibacillus sp. FSL R7-0273]OMF93882.1 hypothetical protein BK144_09730 [Paenibacillus sp. FSL R7-0273]
MGSLIYIAVIILIAIFTNVNKAAKNRKKPNARGGMPTFGGGGDDQPQRRDRGPGPEGSEMRPAGSGFPAPDSGMPSRDRSFGEEHEHELAPAWKESPQVPTPDYETGEGMSYEQSGDQEDSVQARTERMERELKRLQAAYDGMAAYGLEKGTDGAVEAPENSRAAVSPLPGGAAGSAQALRNGLVWAEILGPPRSRRPHSTRR